MRLSEKVLRGLVDSGFYSRYLCGGGALTLFRSVTRLEYFIEELNKDSSWGLKNSIRKYEKVTRIFSGSEAIDISLLCRANAVFFGEEFTEFRKVQNWVGRSLEDATYIPPPPEKIVALVENICNEYNNSKTLELDDAILFYTKLILIHPFADGNGRTARSFLDSIIRKSDTVPLTIDLYRVGLDRKLYREAFSYISIDSDSYFNDYWNDAVKWTESYYFKALFIIQSVNDCLNNKMTLVNVISDFDSLLLYMWLNPVLDEKKLSELSIYFKGSGELSIKSLISFRILKVLSRKESKSGFLFVFEDVFNALIKLDEEVFKNKNSDF